RAAPRRRQVARVETGAEVLLRERNDLGLEDARLAAEMQAEVRGAERGPIRRGEEWDGDRGRREVDEREARADGGCALRSGRRSREDVVRQSVGQLHLDAVDDALSADGASGVQVNAAAGLESAPTGMRVDAVHGDVAADGLDRDARVRAPLARKDDGRGTEVLDDPPETPELRRGNGEPVEAALQLRLEIERA